MEREKEDISIVKILIISIIITIIPIIYVSLFYIPQIQDVPLNTDPNIYAGFGEVCKTPSIEVNCAEDLECVYLSNKPVENGMCLPSDYVLPEDFVNRNNDLGDAKRTINVEWQGELRQITIELPTE